MNRDGGVVEDYLTPENPPPSSLTTVGLSLRPKPWEVCMTLGLKWAYNPHDVYKSTKTVIQTLVSVVATGGSRRSMLVLCRQESCHQWRCSDSRRRVSG